LRQHRNRQRRDRRREHDFLHKFLFVARGFQPRVSGLERAALPD
jgi:hypothetical protein